MEIPVSSQNARLLIKVMDEDMTSDDICSQGYFNINACGAFSQQPNTYRLITYLPPAKDKAPVAGSGGDLRFIAQYFPWFDVILKFVNWIK